VTEHADRPAPARGSFRDPAGRVLEVRGRLVRTVSPAFGPVFDEVRATGLYDALIERGLLVAHEELEPGAVDLGDEQVHTLLQPRRLPFVSYPYEWSPGQLRAAALLTLEVAEVALDHGCVLRDASAYNVQFVGTSPVFIDTLSFAPRVEGEPWAAYNQFCRHFLAPLALQTRVDHRLVDLLRTDVDGVPLDLASGLLPWSTRLRPGLLLHVHAHARATARRRADPDAAPREATLSTRALRGLLDQLRGTVTRLRWRRPPTPWADYYTGGIDHYRDEDQATKAAVVRSFVDRVGPSLVFDLGANTGRFSRVAAEGGADVVALDIDHGAVEVAFDQLTDDPVPAGSVLPLRHDLANPSPPLGWANGERASLVQRGPADLVLALALVHHLAIGNNVPLPMVAEHLASLGRHVVVEWVPPDDRMARVLMATRQRSYDDYHLEGFLDAVGATFELLDRSAVADTGRELFLLRAR
jgi:ribosomal protein L11 methylase PrmA